MRTAILIAAFGLIAALPTTPVFTSAAVAQSAVNQSEMALQAQIVALAQAGNTAGIQALINQQVAAGNAAMLARVARRVAQQGLALAGADTAGAAALAQAAVIIANDRSVSASDSGLAAAIGDTAGQVEIAIQTTDPTSAANLQIAVAQSPNTDLVVSYASSVANTQQQQQTTQTTPTFTPVVRSVVRRTTPPVQQEPVVPIIPEPNPSQSGSPT